MAYRRILSGIDCNIYSAPEIEFWSSFKSFFDTVTSVTLTFMQGNSAESCLMKLLESHFFCLESSEAEAEQSNMILAGLESWVFENKPNISIKDAIEFRRTTQIIHARLMICPANTSKKRCRSLINPRAATESRYQYPAPLDNQQDLSTLEIKVKSMLLLAHCALDSFRNASILATLSVHQWTLSYLEFCSICTEPGTSFIDEGGITERLNYSKSRQKFSAIEVGPGFKEIHTPPEDCELALHIHAVKAHKNHQAFEKLFPKRCDDCGSLIPFGGAISHQEVCFGIAGLGSAPWLSVLYPHFKWLFFESNICNRITFYRTGDPLAREGSSQLLNNIHEKFQFHARKLREEPGTTVDRRCLLLVQNLYRRMCQEESSRQMISIYGAINQTLLRNIASNCEDFVTAGQPGVHSKIEPLLVWGTLPMYISMMITEGSTSPDQAMAWLRKYSLICYMSLRQALGYTIQVISTRKSKHEVQNGTDLTTSGGEPIIDADVSTVRLIHDAASINECPICEISIILPNATMEHSDNYNTDQMYNALLWHLRVRHDNY
ncbi:hypothetical protein TWF788_008221 [Orbilia oligospora]|uniref:Uncharacterized protein n=1 Tax=Orbilia oligospora TaxID=2813651 RepID=A0A7C8Q2P1_ORBOL|nr:hypothetical protein TWF788_008221 [Orbilia oligospora]